jgi:hypothetical protein
VQGLGRAFQRFHRLPQLASSPRHLVVAFPHHHPQVPLPMPPLVEEDPPPRYRMALVPLSVVAVVLSVVFFPPSPPSSLLFIRPPYPYLLSLLPRPLWGLIDTLYTFLRSCATLHPSTRSFSSSGFVQTPGLVLSSHPPLAYWNPSACSLVRLCAERESSEQG